MSDLLCAAIDKRFSCRYFDAKKPVPTEIIEKVLLAASKAPSGKNGQPWRFRILSEDAIQSVSKLLSQNKWLVKATQCVAVFLDTDAVYDMQKDSMAIGACIENMILEATANELQSCWIGECNNYRKEINQILGIDEKYTLMALVALGYGRQIGAHPKKQMIKALMI